MGVLPLQFKEGENATTHQLTGYETFSLEGISDTIKPRAEITVKVTRQDGTPYAFTVIARLDSVVEIDYYRNGGILPTVLRNIMRA